MISDELLAEIRRATQPPVLVEDESVREFYSGMFDDIEGIRYCRVATNEELKAFEKQKNLLEAANRGIRRHEHIRTVKH